MKVENVGECVGILIEGSKDIIYFVMFLKILFYGSGSNILVNDVIVFLCLKKIYSVEF